MAKDLVQSKNGKAQSADIAKPKVDKYLVDLKELPPTSKGEIQENEEKKVERVPRPPQAKTEEREKLKSEPETIQVEEVEEKEEERKGSKLPISSKDVILAIINSISVVLLVILLVRLPERSNELKKLRIEDFRNQSDPSINLAELEESGKKVDQMNELFLDESGLVDFINEVEKLKGEGSAILKVAIKTQKAVKDQTGNFGVPIVIELQGSWQTIGQDLERIQVLPFLFRTATVEIKRSADDPNVILFNYGVFLYVDDTKFAQ